MELYIENDELRLELQGFERLLAVRKQLIIPVSQITGVHHERPPLFKFEMRSPGTFLPGLIKAGTFSSKDGRDFWYVHQWQKDIVVIELQAANKKKDYSRIILSNERAREWGDRVKAALRAQERKDQWSITRSTK